VICNREKAIKIVGRIIDKKRWAGRDNKRDYKMTRTFYR
jgi:hypothetical protein